MAFTRFKYDEARTKKELQQSTDPGRWVMNVPGNGETPYYIEDPHIRIQTWGGNMRTNTINLESDLLGVNRKLNRDNTIKDSYVNFTAQSDKIEYPATKKLTTEQSRTILPAWTARDLEQVNWYYPQLNPQENICFPFLSNVNTRILERDK
jgi:hypothetical protein